MQIGAPLVDIYFDTMDLSCIVTLSKNILVLLIAVL